MTRRYLLYVETETEQDARVAYDEILRSGTTEQGQFGLVDITEMTFLQGQISALTAAVASLLFHLGQPAQITDALQATRVLKEDPSWRRGFDSTTGTLLRALTHSGGDFVVGSKEGMPS